MAVFWWLGLVRTVSAGFASAFVSMHRTEVVVRCFVKMVVVRCMEMDTDINGLWRKSMPEEAVFSKFAELYEPRQMTYPSME